MANNIVIYDHTASQVTVKSTDNAGVHTPHHNVDGIALPSSTSFLANTVAVGNTTATVVPFPSGVLYAGVTVKAMETNTSVIYLGGATVSMTNCFRLVAGDVVFVPINQLSAVCINCTSTSNGVSFVAS